MNYPADGDDRTLTATVDRRRLLLVRGFRYYHYRRGIAYSQARPTQLLLPRETTRLDCSGLVAACMDYAGVLPKIDWRYTNTWLQDDLGVRVTTTAAKPGDVVFYGPRLGNPTHEALYLGSLAQVKTVVDVVPAEVLDRLRNNGRCVLTMGSYPMDIRPVDYRSDRVEIRRFV